MKFKILSLLFITVFAGSAYAAYPEGSYNTPDSWSKNITANGVKAATDPIKLGEKGGSLTMGLTTRLQMKIAGESDLDGFQYLRARLSDTRIGNGTMDVNLNMRIGADFNRQRHNPREYYVFYDSLDLESRNADAAFRLYQANITLKDLLPGLKVEVGRAYLNNLSSYKIDGAALGYSFWQDNAKVYAYYGMPVSYYSDLETQVAGGGVDIKLFNGDTRLRGEYSIFLSTLDNYDANTNVGRVRIDQRVLFTNVYGELSQVQDATIYKIGIDGNIEQTNTGFSIYMDGQYSWNDDGVNPYVASFEAVTGKESQYILWGVQVYQGITEHIMAGIGYEARFNYDESYADRDFYRIYGNIDLIGLIHSENFLSIIADYYIVPSFANNKSNDKLLLGARTSQKFGDYIDAWAGVNVASYKYSANPIQLNPLFATNLTEFDTGTKDEHTTAAYIGASYQLSRMISFQGDYTFEMTDIFKSYDAKDDNCHTVALWLNILL